MFHPKLLYLVATSSKILLLKSLRLLDDLCFITRLSALSEVVSEFFPHLQRFCNVLFEVPRHYQNDFFPLCGVLRTLVPRGQPSQIIVSAPHAGSYYFSHA